MQIKAGILIFLLTITLTAVSLAAGCQQTEVDILPEEQVILESEGILVGQIDSQSVEIEVEGEPRTFGLGPGVTITGISDGSAVTFSYVEEETRPLLLSIEAVRVENDVIEGEGVYNGQIDSHSVEVEFENQPTAFALGEGVTVDHIVEGSRVAFTYQEGAERFVLLTIVVIDESGEPVDGVSGELVGEGVLVGQIDAQSVEMEINRAFVLGDQVSVEEIEDGSQVAFTYTETGLRAVLESIEEIDSPVEGEVMQGTMIGSIDGQSVEINYFQAFALGEGVNVLGIEDGSEVVFTYREAPHRPILTSITAK